MVMKFVLRQWKLDLVFTGVLIMGVNPRNRKFCSHVDRWDSIGNNAYFSLEGLLDVVKRILLLMSRALNVPILHPTTNGVFSSLKELSERQQHIVEITEMIHGGHDKNLNF